MKSNLPPLTTRLIQVTCAIVWCLVAAGPVFGFAAIKPIFTAEHIYESKCDVSTTSSSEVKCVQQDLSLNLLFTVACMVTNISALPVGSILDSYGPQITGIIGSFLLALGALSMKFAHAISFFDGYLTGYTLLALAGPFVFISCFQLANCFPKNSGLVLALLTGAFDSSSALFLFYRLYYTEVSPLPISKFFTLYLVVPAFIFLCQVFIMPHDSYKTVGTLAKIAETGIDETGRPLDEDLLYSNDRDQDLDSTEYYQPTISETTSLLMRRASGPTSRRESTVSRASYCSTKSRYEQEADTKLIKTSGGVFGVLHGYSIKEQLNSGWFILMTLFTTIQMLRINYFVATVKSQELYLYNGNEELATTINHFFDLALPLGGLFSIPFIGLILDNLTTLTVLYILTGLSLFIGVAGLMSWLPATYAGIIALVVYRPFYYTAVSDFCAKVFGYDNFGTVYGTIIAFSGVCNILQQVMDKATHEYFNMNPNPVNTILVILTAVFGITLIGYVKSQEAHIRRKNLEMEAQDATNRQIPV
ncbi:putative mitochondrial membrane protein [Candida maltosa Xu316]|uniref:Putative mitochondrial membrane protein n=1 Tax=Candida maltosa (strain Xu316) TaxID=1245528 RepID=M3IQK5_CANMX|nr:putative mitochondrial membrane protein [Candida maltosa Xu316]